MRNSKFSLAAFQGGRQLSREEMKKVVGGDGGPVVGGTTCTLSSAPQCPPGQGCCYNGDGTYSCKSLVPISPGSGNVSCPSTTPSYSTLITN